jgi:hypothetical protein
MQSKRASARSKTSLKQIKHGAGTLKVPALFYVNVYGFGVSAAATVTLIAVNANKCVQKTRITTSLPPNFAVDDWVA